MVKKTTHFMPRELKSFLKERALEVFGLALLIFGVSIFLAVETHDKFDPSINVALEGSVQNILGAYGATLSDTLFRFFGIACLLPAITFCLWGWLLIKEKRIEKAYLRVPSFFVSFIFICPGLEIFPLPQNWNFISGMGGAVGTLNSQWAHYFINTYLGNIQIYIPQSVLCLLFLSIGFFLYGFSNFITKDKLNFVYQIAKSSITWLIGVISYAYHKLTLKKSSPTAPQEESFSPPTLSKPVFSAAKPKIVKSTPEKETAAPLPLDLALDQKEYEIPDLDLLANPPEEDLEGVLSTAEIEKNAEHLQSVLDDFGVRGKIEKIHPGPVVTLYELHPAPGIKSSRIIGLADDIARSMSAVSARVAVIPGQNAIGIELPNPKREHVYLRQLLENEKYEQTASKLALVLGKDIGGNPIIVDLARMPHLLVAGTTGSGKSVSINTMILSLLYRLPPSRCKLIMIDPKMLELSVYDDIPHLLCPVVTEPRKAVVALKWVVREMENRYKSMSQLGVRNIDGYNLRRQELRDKGETLTQKVQTGFDPESGLPIFEEKQVELNEMPYIVVIVDEMADLMLVAGKDIEAAVQRLAQMARAAGIHLIMATQRPSVDVITGTIKANFPTRISFQVTSKIDSRTILGEQGAEQLLGQGDMLYMAAGGRITRVHGPFVSDLEVEKVVNHLKSKGEPTYIETITQDDSNGDAPESLEDKDSLYDQAVSIVLQEKKASTSFIQRHLQIGYNRAARIMESMEKQGIVSPANHVGKREILVTDQKVG